MAVTFLSPQVAVVIAHGIGNPPNVTWPRYSVALATLERASHASMHRKETIRTARRQDIRSSARC
jgi:hypothetical protein